MTFSQLVFCFVAAVVFVYFLIRFVRGAEMDDVVSIPTHVPISDVDTYTAQEIFNWVVYVTKVSGKAYLEQLNWSPGSRHSFLLADLRTVLHARSEDEVQARFEEIGHSFSLDLSIVDAPY